MILCGVLLSTVFTIAIAIAKKSTFTENNCEFAINFYDVIAESNPNENFVISPISVQTSAAMLFTGAVGKTAIEMVEGFKFVNNDITAVGESFKEFLSNYKNHLIIANKIYVNKKFKVKPEFHQHLTEYYDSIEESIDFYDEGATDTINGWVNKITKHKISKVFDEKIPRNTQILLVNAIYFKAEWEKPFQTLDSHTVFWLNTKENINCPQMLQLAEFKYKEIDQLHARVLEMEYKDTSLSMVIVLPNELDGLNELEINLASVNLLELTEGINKSMVDVALPKFTIEFSLNLQESLAKLNVTEMFTEHANFGNIVAEGHVSVGTAVHKAFIEVNEKGTEAAAVSGISIKPNNLNTMFYADHPFFFYIKTETEIVFEGRFCCP